MIPSNHEIYTKPPNEPLFCIEYNTANINIANSSLKKSLIAGTLFLALTFSQSGTNNITNLNEIANKSLKKNNFSLVLNNAEEARQQMLEKNKKSVSLLSDNPYSYIIGEEWLSQNPNNNVNEVRDMNKLTHIKKINNDTLQNNSFVEESMQLFKGIGEFTKEENLLYDESILTMFKPTGRNFFDL